MSSGHTRDKWDGRGYLGPTVGLELPSRGGLYLSGPQGAFLVAERVSLSPSDVHNPGINEKVALVLGP